MEMVDSSRVELVTLRHATQDDLQAIRDLIDAVSINPKGLDWKRFVLAVDADDRLIGCGQIKPHRDGTYELASIAVRPEWRKRGVASAIIRQLLGTNPHTLYGICRSNLKAYYETFGFVEVANPTEMPLHFRWLILVIHVFQRLALIDERVFNISNKLGLGVTHEPSLILRYEVKVVVKES